MYYDVQQKNKKNLTKNCQCFSRVASVSIKFNCKTRVANSIKDLIQAKAYNEGIKNLNINIDSF